MFKKLLKYDMRSVSKYWWIGAAISLGASIMGALLMRFFMYIVDSEEPNTFLILIGIFSMIVAILCVLAVALSFVLTIVLVFVRFYKHFFTDEGYLTFTLPASRSALFLSKTVNAVIWYSLHFVVLAVSILLFAILIVPPEEGQFFIQFSVFEVIGDWLVASWELVGAWFIVYAFEALLLAFLYMIFTISLIHLCITFGSIIAKKARLLAFIGLYYAFSTVFSMLVQFGTFLVGGFMGPGFSFLLENAAKNQEYAAYSLVLLIIAAVIGAIAFALYSLTQYLLDRKLNLA